MTVIAKKNWQKIKIFHYQTSSNCATSRKPKWRVWKKPSRKIWEGFKINSTLTTTKTLKELKLMNCWSSSINSAENVKLRSTCFQWYRALAMRSMNITLKKVINIEKESTTNRGMKTMSKMLRRSRTLSNVFMTQLKTILSQNSMKFKRV